jgi:hypothetical protein
MAGTIIADFIRTDANQLSLNVGNTTFATINASGFFSNTGTQLIAANGAINGASVIAGSIPAGKLGAASVARTNMYGILPELVMLTGASAGVSMATVGTYYKMLWGSEINDPYNQFSSSTFTCASTGTYWLEVETNARLNNTGDVYQNFIYKNGTAFSSQFEQGISDSNAQTNMHYTMYLSLSAGDTIELYSRWTGTGTSRTSNHYSGNAWWAIWRLT